VEPQARGTIILGASHYIQKKFDAEQRARIYAQCAPELRSLEKFDKKGWYPIPLANDLWRGIANVRGNPEASYDDVVQCGRFYGIEATGTFMRLMVKFLTPKVFARKFPDIWTRYFDFGKVEADVSHVEEKRVVFHITGVDGLQYFSQITVGWFSHGFEAMGLKNLKVTESIPITQPSSARHQFDLTWS
jgi:hypothetical protein